MSVVDHGIEAIRKAANQVTPGDNTEYYLATKIIDALAGTFVPQGAQNFIKSIEISLSDSTWTLLTTGSQSSRNALRILNRTLANPTGVVDVFVNGDTPSGHIGEILHPNDVSDISISNVDVYAKAAIGSGGTTITITELG